MRNNIEQDRLPGASSRTLCLRMPGGRRRELGLSATTNWIVEQLATGKIRRSCHRSRCCIFTSGTTNGTAGSMRKAEELSMTMQPLAAAFGLISRELVAPVDRNRRSVPEKSNVARSRTDICSPRKLIERPPEAAEARGITSEAGNPRRSNNRSISLPTLPVAPPTAILIPPLIPITFILITIPCSCGSGPASSQEPINE